MFRRIYEAFERMATAAERQAASVEEQTAAAKEHYADSRRLTDAAIVERETATQRHREEIEFMREEREHRKQWNKTKDRAKTESGRSSED